MRSIVRFSLIIIGTRLIPRFFAPHDGDEYLFLASSLDGGGGGGAAIEF
jgi:hypothetical protein